MEINGSNISSTIADSISKLNLNGVKTLKNTQNNVNISKEESIEAEEKINVIDDNSSRRNIDVEDIKKYASAMGENLTTEDINYGLMYGRSVIADYSA